MRKLVLLTFVLVAAAFAGAPSAMAADHRCPPGSSVLPPVVDGNVIVESGAFCIGFNSQIKGNVDVLQNAIGFHLHGGRVEGSVQSENPQLDIRILAATVTGSVKIKKTRPGTAGGVCRSEIFGDVILEENRGITTVGIGFPADVCTAGNTIHGQVKLEKNQFMGIWNVVGNQIGGNLQVAENSVVGSTDISRNTVGQDLQLFKNVGTTTLNTNTVRENLQCKENVAPPTGAGNTAKSAEDQCAALAAPLAPAAAAAATPTLGVYDCYSKGAARTAASYRGSVQLKAKNRYAQSIKRKGRTLIKARAGSYRAWGSRITWTSGRLAQLYGVVKTAARFELYAKGATTKGSTCYRKL
jgi:hypothetical protein